MMPLYFSPELFTTDKLLYKSSWTSFHRGQEYFSLGRVKSVYLGDQEAVFEVQGTKRYRVEFVLMADGQDFYSDCSCPQGRKGYFCKHQVASGLYMFDYLQKFGKGQWKQLLDNVIHTKKRRSQKEAPYLLFFLLTEERGNWELEPVKLLAKDFPADVPGPDDPAFLEIVQKVFRKWDGLYGKLRKQRSSLSASMCLNGSEGVVTMANVMIRENRLQRQYYYYDSAAPAVGEFLSFLRSHHAPILLANMWGEIEGFLTVLPGVGKLVLLLQEDGEGNLSLLVQGEAAEMSFLVDAKGFELVSGSPLWGMADRRYLFQLPASSDAQDLAMLPKLSGAMIRADEKDLFLDQYLLPLMKRVEVRHNRLRWVDIKDELPVKRLYLMEEGGELLVSLRFGYGDHEVRYSKTAEEVTLMRDEEDPWLFIRVHRQLAMEQETYGSLSSSRTGLKRGGADYYDDIFRLRARVDPVDFLLRKVPLLLKDGFEVYGEDELKNVRVNRHQPTISLNVTSGIDWFDVQAVVKFGDIDVPLKEIRQAMRRKERFVKLADGSIGEIPEAWIEKYRHLFRLGEQTEEGVRLADYHMTLIDELLAQADHAQVDDAFQQRLHRLKDFSGIEEKPLPQGFTGELREYQKAGYYWLHFLHDYGFGGILADDMGLGKTVQVLVFLLSLKESGEAQTANLIVVPRSLLVNWQREVERFTPSLRVYQHFGQGRRKDIKVFENYDIILTTYGTMRQDIQFLREHPFHYAVLDESQAIKNPLSQTAKAARLLKADHRLAMTGTPVENNAFELWSQFAFVNPGLLGGLEYFRQEFAVPIERRGDEAAAQFLRKMVYPFILRRTKDQVARELPPRTERVLYCDMEPAQRRFYIKTRDHYRSMLLGIVEEQGMNQARMKVLEGLLRLRQISNHPRLVNPKFRGDSAKLAMLMQELETLRDSGHKALVFSQFVKMLKLVRQELDARKIPYVYLDGRTRKRQERVDEFQNNPDIPFFLISLKAGGVGLNLTAADYVIHIDPWWNPAVEMQATDRTHRIGQDKPVFVYKLIARDTVEEKILQLQERKKALVSQLISTESSFFKSLTAEDIETLFS